jgi:hypothetical protein
MVFTLQVPFRFWPKYPTTPNSTGVNEPRADYRRCDPRSMVPVRLAGAEVTEAFWAKLAVLF